MRKDIDPTTAKGIARLAGVKLPRMGYEVYLGRGLWLASNFHAQFGSFGMPKTSKPFSVRTDYRRKV